MLSSSSRSSEPRSWAGTAAAAAASRLAVWRVRRVPAAPCGGPAAAAAVKSMPRCPTNSSVRTAERKWGGHQRCVPGDQACRGSRERRHAQHLVGKVLQLLQYRPACAGDRCAARRTC